MCVVSMVGDHYREDWIQKWPTSYPSVPFPGTDKTYPMEQVSRREFDELKKQVEEMVALLKRAKEYDERNGEPDCEMDEKMDLLRRVAKLVGVDLDQAIATKH